jgi:phosphopantetheine adenylyltransferase
MRVLTFNEFVAEKHKAHEIVVVRGLRNKEFVEHEKRLMLENKKKYGLSRYFYIFGSPASELISSAKAREIASTEGFSENLLDQVCAKVGMRLRARAIKLGKVAR